MVVMLGRMDPAEVVMLGSVTSIIVESSFSEIVDSTTSSFTT